MDSKNIARSREQEIQHKQNEEEGPAASEILASIMKSILSSGDLMAMTKLLSQKLKKSDNKDLLLSEIGRVERMLLNTINVVRSCDSDMDLAPVNKMLSNAQEVQVCLNKMKAILPKGTANGREKGSNSPIYLSILSLLCPCVRCHDV